MNTNYPTDYEAWLTGFQYGVKACLNNDTRYTIDEFHDKLLNYELDDLTLWMNVGRDTNNGIWAITGVRMGIYMVMLTEWDYSTLDNEMVLSDIWNTIKHDNPEMVCGRVNDDLVEVLGLPIVMLDSEASKFFKIHCQPRLF
jgi:hypothetical protein